MKIDEELRRRVEFAEKHVTDKSGRPWTAKGRDWVMNEFWGAVDGFKAWPDGDHLCDKCAAKANSVIREPKDLKKCRRKTEGQACGGLRAEPIIMSILCLPRRSGKSFNTAAYSLAQLCQGKNKRIAFVASSEDQMKSLFLENYAEAIERSPALSKACDVRESYGQIRVAHSRGFFEGLSTSHGSVTGRGRTHVIIDEARDVPARVAMALIPSVYEAGGFECAHGHVQLGVNDKIPRACPVCKGKLTQWWGRVLIMSSAGMIEDLAGEKAWFAELVEDLRANPQPNVHLYETSENINPDVSEKVTGTVEAVFGRLESTKSYVAIEVGNRFTRKGEDFVTRAEILQVTDRKLKNRHESGRNCVAFLDTSKVNDLTSLVIASEDLSVNPDPWGHLTIERIDVWNPKDQPGGVINPEVILRHLDDYLPLFPNMKALRVDTRAMPWAIALVRKAKREKSWGRIVDGWNKQRAERKSSWSIFLQRILSQTITMPENKDLIAELLGVRKIEDIDGQMDIRDRNRKKRHVDIGDGIAVCCYLAHLEAIQGRTSLKATVNQSAARDILQKLYRPGRQRSIDLDKF